MNELIQELAQLVLIHGDKIKTLHDMIQLQEKRIEGLTDLVERSAILIVKMSETATQQERELQDLKKMVSHPRYYPMEN